MLSWFPRSKEAAELGYPSGLANDNSWPSGAWMWKWRLRQGALLWGILGGVGAKDVVVVPCVGGQE